jgi:hypothetical protein
VPETKLVESSGSGVVASGGSTIEIEWSKGALGDPIELTAGGEPVELDPGSTWIGLVPLATGSYSVSR